MSGCPTALTYTFTDTTGDDVADTSLFDFFTSLTSDPNDYIYFEQDRGGSGIDAWCSERADFYRDTYLQWATAGQIVSSGTWNKWYGEDGVWDPAVTTGHDNRYGGDCGGDYAWCSEDGGTVARRGAVSPGQTDDCEASLHDGGGTIFCSIVEVLTISVADTRLDACGF